MVYNKYENDTPELVVPTTPEPKSLSISDKIDNLLVSGGEISVECNVEEFQHVLAKYKPQRRACKLELSWSDGLLHGSARL